MKARIEPEARYEIRQAKDWYEQQRVGLGVEFVEAIRTTIDRVRENPRMYQLSAGSSDIRGAIVDRFPYVILYLVHQHTLRILAVAHQHRDPTLLLRSASTRRQRL